MWRINFVLFSSVAVLPQNFIGTTYSLTDIMLKGALNSLTLTLNFKHTYLINVILSSCQYQHLCISILTVRPEIKCGNFSAMSGDKFVDMTCRIELKGISMKQQSAERHAVPLVHIILISSQPVFALSP
jgi:hypothetical protein